VSLIRHGEGAHNATGRYNICDPFLTQVGVKQAQALRSNEALKDCELLVVSPLSRAIQTSVAIFGEHPSCRVVLSPLVSERWTGACDEGRPKSQLLASFPFLASWEGFDSLPEEWTPKKGSDDNWREQRVPAVRAWLKRQPEHRVVIVGHGCFFEGLSGKYLSNCEVYRLMDPEDILRRLHPSLGTSTRREAAEHLGSMSNAMLTFSSEIVQLLGDREAIVRANAVRCAGRIGKVSKDPALKGTLAEKISNMLADSSIDVRCNAAEALGDLGIAAKSFVGAVHEHLNDQNEVLRQNAAWAIGQLLKREEVVEAKESAAAVAGSVCESPASKRRRISCKSPQKPSETDYAQQLARLLDDTDDLVQWYAVEALGHMGKMPCESVDRVAEFLKHSQADVVQNAAWTLGQAGDVASLAVAKLLKLLTHKTIDVRYYAVEALGYIGGDAVGQSISDVLKRLQDDNADVRKVAAWAIGRFAGKMKSMPKELVGCLRDDDASVRESAVEALGCFGSRAKPYLKGITKLLDDPDSEVRRVAGTVTQKLNSLASPARTPQKSPARQPQTQVNSHMDALEI